MSHVKVRSRAVAVYIQMESGLHAVITAKDFKFHAVRDSNGVMRVSGKSVGEWEREFAMTRDAIINRLNRSFGDEQRELKHIKQENTHG